MDLWVMEIFLFKKRDICVHWPRRQENPLCLMCLMWMLEPSGSQPRVLLTPGRHLAKSGDTLGCQNWGAIGS